MPVKIKEFWPGSPPPALTSAPERPAGIRGSPVPAPGPPVPVPLYPASGQAGPAPAPGLSGRWGAGPGLRAA